MIAPAPIPLSSPDAAEAMRVQMVQAVIDAVKSRAHPGSTVDAAAKAAGFSPKLIEHHFGNTAVLMTRVVDRLLVNDGPSHDPGWPHPTEPLADRAHQTLGLLWRGIYEPERFLLAWQVYLGCREDQPLLASIAAKRRIQQASLIQRFLTLFPEMQDSPDTRCLLELLLSSLRGMGLIRLFDPADESIPKQLTLLAQLLVRHCESGHQTG